MDNNICPVKGCGCVGYAYVPYQFLNTVFSPEDGLEQGTVFPELNLSMSEYGKICKSIGGTADEQM